MRILYIDPIFGISGDMMISALINAGLPFSEVEVLLKKLPVSVPFIEPVDMTHDVFRGTHLNIADSDIHLSISEMENILAAIDIGDRMRQHARAMLELILAAESKIHGTTREELHLHELSSIDTLIDLLCVSAGIDYFGIEKVFCGPVPCGRGTIKTAHGIIPNPPPVTLEILSGCPLVFYDEPLELTTPTGAAIVKHFAHKTKSAPPFVPEKIGYGVGSYKTVRPDVLRIFIGLSESNDEEIWMLECDIDDMEMEYVGAAADRIRDAGALDVLYFPVFMKKGRPGIRLSVIVSDASKKKIVDTILRETTTFGLRMRKEKREVLRREIKIAETSLGPVHVKYGFDATGTVIKTHVEFEDVKQIADNNNIPYAALLTAIKSEVK